MPYRTLLSASALSAILLIGLYSALPARAQPQAGPPAIVDAGDYPTLQAALDAVPDSGGVVQLPPGTFRIDEPLIVSTPNTRLEGSGTATHIINQNREGEPALIARHPDHAPDEGQSVRLWRVQLVDFRISGNPESGDGVLLLGINEPFVHNMTIDHHGGRGLHMIDCYEDPRVSSSVITYNRLAGLRILGGHDIVVSDNQFEENQDAVRCIDSFNLTMSGNNLDDHLRHGIVIENTYGSVVSGNMIEESQGTAIILDRDCYGITLSANVIAHDFGGGIDLRDAWGSTVSANTFTIVPEYAVRVGPKSGRVTITGNNFSDSYIGDGQILRSQPSPATGVLLERTSDVSITGNVFTGMAGSAVRTEGTCRRIVVQSNVITDVSRSAPGQHPAVDLNEEDNTIEGNRIHEKEPVPTSR